MAKYVLGEQILVLVLELELGGRHGRGVFIFESGDIDTGGHLDGVVLVLVDLFCVDDVVHDGPQGVQFIRTHGAHITDANAADDTSVCSNVLGSPFLCLALFGEFNNLPVGDGQHNFDFEIR